MFTTTYEESQERFAGLLDPVRQWWPQAGLTRHPIGQENLTVDLITADPNGSPDRVLLITTGQHGMEGYVGSAMLQLFVNEFIDQIDPERTGLVLLHALNPWGMKHHRRVDEANVDLNRNFLPDWSALDRSANQGYRTARTFFAEQGVGFWTGFAQTLLRLGVKGLKQATLLGQYEFPQGIYYGGNDYRPNTRLLIDLYRELLRRYDQVLQIDMHTGFGPRYQMSVVNSALDPQEPAALIDRFGYPLVVRTTPTEFYAIAGDMIDFVYHLARTEFPQKRLYATCFEFGTLGDSLLAGVQSLKRMIEENRAHHWGVPPNRVDAVKAAFRELFYPSEEAWRQKALADCRQALTGVLRAQGFIH